jgi:hypothetical protein
MFLRNAADNLRGEANLHPEECKYLKTMFLRKRLKFRVRALRSVSLVVLLSLTKVLLSQL